jgi:hypothetical protein
MAQVDEARDADDRDWDVDSVLTVVQKAARTWNPDRLQRFPDLRCAAYQAATAAIQAVLNDFYDAACANNRLHNRALINAKVLPAQLGWLLVSIAQKRNDMLL